MSAERKAEYDEYIQNALGGPGNNNEKQFTIGKVDARIAKWLERFGKKISSDAVHVIADNDVRHIRNRHGIAKEGQYGVTTGDLQAIPYILKNAKEKYFFPRSDGKSGILYVTDGVDTTYYVEEIFSEDALTGKQMIKTKKGTVPSAYEKAVKKKHFLPLPIRQQTLFPGCTSKTLGNMMLLFTKYHRQTNLSTENFLRTERTGRRYPSSVCRGNRKRASTPSVSRRFFIWYGQPGITLHTKERIESLLPFGAQTSPAAASCAF